MSAPAAATTVTIVTQTRVGDEAGEEFARWQSQISAAVAAFPGFIEQSVMPPNPPAQADWVILQRFANLEAATAWLHSSERLGLVEAVQPILAGPVDVHLVRDTVAGVLPALVSVVIATRVKPGAETAYRQWEQRIAAAQSRATGFQGFRFEPPVPGVQDDWLTILRFDSEPHLQAWLASPVRLKLLEEAKDFIEEFHTRIARTGFGQWFAGEGSAAAPPAWKQNMVVLLLLYPVVFLFGVWVQNPLLIKAARLPFPLTLFMGNVVSIVLLNYLVPFVSGRLAWWLVPDAERRTAVTLAGAGLLVALYAVLIAVFVRLS